MIVRFCLTILLSLGIATPFLSAAPIFFTGLEVGYTPGVPLSFDVGLPAITNLGSYNIDLILTGDTGVAGTDFFFDVTGTAPVASGYVFPSAANFFAAVNVDSPSMHRLTLTDFDFVGTNVVTGVNDHVATIVVRTDPSFQGRLVLIVDALSLFLDTPDLVPTPVPEFDGIQDSVAAAQPEILLPVPEPASFSGLVGLLTLALIRRCS